MLRIRLLGDLEVARGDRPLSLPPSRKTRALLGFLVATGCPHRRERLCEMLWDVPDDPRGALRWSLSKLRGLVDEPAKLRIVADRETVAFDGQGADIDLLRIRSQLGGPEEALSVETLLAAATAFRGELLGGLELPNAPDFSAWCAAEREEARLLHRRILGLLVDRLAGRPEAALPHARSLVRLAPYDEAAWAGLVRLLSAAGRREEAEQQLAIGRRMLADASLPESGALQAAWRASQTRRPGPTAGDSATARAGAGAGSRLEPAGPVSPEPALAPIAERKQVTMLCVAAGEMADGEADPELVMRRSDRLAVVLREAVQRYEGTVVPSQGGVQAALFGAPKAHEDHATRACYAALAVQEALRQPEEAVAGPRIGLHAGEAVVRPADDGTGWEAVGPVAPRAAQLAAEAAPGAILMSAEVLARTEGFVRARRLQRDGVSGGPQPVFLLEGATAARTRWEARAARGLTRFVGRQEEMTALVRAMRRAGQGQGQVVAVLADPGMGKSRLVHEFVRGAVPAEWAVIETGASAYDSGVAYLPFSKLLRRWCGVEERDSKPAVADRLRQRIARYPELRQALPALLALLDLPVEDPSWPTLSPGQRRRRTLEAIRAVLVRESQDRPLLLLFEDMHWVDGESQAALDALVDGLGALRMLLLVTARPEYRHGWLGKSYFSQIRLDPLAAAAADDLLQSLLGHDPALSSLRRGLVARTEGTPLFLEEAVRALAESGTLAGRPGAYRLTGRAGSFETPATISAILAARIDRLPAGSKALLQTAAVIGRDLPLAILERVAGLSEERLRDELAALQAAEFLYEVRLLPDTEYTFKHALTHEVAYASVLRDRRRTLHRELVRTIEDYYRDRLDEQVERLAHHAAAGELWAEAVHYIFRAANKAIQRSAHAPAAEFLARGLSLIPLLEDERTRIRTELDFQKALGVTMMAAKGWGAQEVSDALTRARALAERLRDERELFTVLRGQGQFHMIRGELATARELGERCLSLSQDSADPALQIETHHLFWSNSFFMGDYANAVHHSDRGIGLYRRERDHPLTFVYSGHDPGVCCRAFSALLLWIRGEPQGAVERCREALALAETMAHPLTLALAQWAFGYAHMFRREPAEVKLWAEREIAVCEEYLLPLLHSQARFQLGWACAEQGDLEGGLRLMRDGLDSIRATGAEMGRPYFAALTARRSRAQVGRPRVWPRSRRRSASQSRTRPGSSFRRCSASRGSSCCCRDAGASQPRSNACAQRSQPQSRRRRPCRCSAPAPAWPVSSSSIERSATRRSGFSPL